MPIRRKTMALYPPERDEICVHDHAPYLGPAPFPGNNPRRCVMCGMDFEDDDDLARSRAQAVEARLRKDAQEGRLRNYVFHSRQCGKTTGQNWYYMDDDKKED